MKLYQPRDIGCECAADVSYADPATASAIYEEPRTRLRDEDAPRVFLMCRECRTGSWVFVEDLDFAALDDGPYHHAQKGGVALTTLADGHLLGPMKDVALSARFFGSTLAPAELVPHQAPIKKYEIYQMSGPEPDRDIVFRPLV